MSDEKKGLPDAAKPHRFRPGQSGNPGGRSKLEKHLRNLVGTDIDAMIYVQRCIALCIPPSVAQIAEFGIVLTLEQREAIEAFPRITPRDASKSFDSLLDRGWGKAKQHVRITEGNGSRMPKKMRDMSDAQLAALAALDDGLEGVSDDDVEGFDAGEPDGATEH
jgi:hypothetical protein